MRRRPLRERLLSKILKNEITGCWEWVAKLGWSGYGMLKTGGRPVWRSAHRVSYAEFVKEPGSLMVLHKCNNRRCINPDHLYLGTAKENHRDAVAAGTAANNFQQRQKPKFSFNGETLSLINWAARLGIGKSSLRCRLKSGWPIERALTTPAIRRRERDNTGRYRNA